MLRFKIEENNAWYACERFVRRVRVRTQVCVWKEIYINDFIPFAQKKGYSWSADADKEGSNATWRAGKKKALQQFAEETYGPDFQKPFRLIARADHSAFKECAECKKLRLAVARAISEGKDHCEIQREKRLQKEHLDWFMAQRDELERLRQSGAREDTIFEQARECSGANARVSTIAHVRVCAIEHWHI